VPLDRGILETIYVKTRANVTNEQIADAMNACYADAPFVRVTGDALPEIKHVAWTNFCDIGWKFDAATRRLVLVAVIDNLVKGAAGQAIQNFNIIHDLDERTALL
jgi:N-acetyl-gamma-glutamyl-phosphate reductase